MSSIKPSMKSKYADVVSVVVFALLSVALLFVGNPSKPSEISKETATVLEVDNSSIERLGLLTNGFQSLKVKIETGVHKGKVFRAENALRAQMDLDKIFSPNDKIVVAVPQNLDPNGDPLNAQDFQRANYTLWLFLLFAALLILFAGWTGLKALLSFAFSAIFIWKIVVPFCLSGMNAILVCFVAVALLSFAIIFLVAGFSRKAVTAFSGAMFGVGFSCVMAYAFAKVFHINGGTMPFSQALLYSGHEYLNLSDLFVGGIFLSSSGAVMDLAMDVAAGQEEVFYHHQKISRKALAISGWQIGKSVVGTMTTTLLLAYSGGALTLIMAFTAEGVSAMDFINNPYVASEIVKTIIGSFGLVLVAPFTAVIGGILIPSLQKRRGLA